jgi:hypothetical protein
MEISFQLFLHGKQTLKEKSRELKTATSVIVLSMRTTRVSLKCRARPAKINSMLLASASGSVKATRATAPSVRITSSEKTIILKPNNILSL